MLSGAIPPLQHILGNVLPFVLTDFWICPRRWICLLFMRTSRGHRPFYRNWRAHQRGREMSDVASLAFRSDCGACTLLVDEGAQAFQLFAEHTRKYVELVLAVLSRRGIERDRVELLAFDVADP